MAPRCRPCPGRPERLPDASGTRAARFRGAGAGSPSWLTGISDALGAVARPALAVVAAPPVAGRGGPLYGARRRGGADLFTQRASAPRHDAAFAQLFRCAGSPGAGARYFAAAGAGFLLFWTGVLPCGRDITRVRGRRAPALIAAASDFPTQTKCIVSPWPQRSRCCRSVGSAIAVLVHLKSAHGPEPPA